MWGMDISSTADFAADPQTVMEMLTTKEFLEEVSRAAGASDIEVTVDGDTTINQRALPAPDQIAKFTGPKITVVEQIVWGPAAGDGSRDGAVTLTVPGQPVKMTGTAALAPGGRGSTIDISGDLKVNIPLLGKTIEKSTAPAILEAVEIQQEVGDKWLAERA